MSHIHRSSETMTGTDAIPDHHREVDRHLRGFASAVERIAADIEAGQAATPLSDGLRRAGAGSEDQILSVVLIGIAPEAVSRLLSWLLGHEYHLCKLVVPQRTGYAELLLQERGFIVESGDRRQEFDELQSFVEALQDADLVQSDNPDSWMDPIRLRLSTPGGRRGLRLLIPTSIEALVRKPALLSLLADRATLALVAGDAEGRLPEGSTESLALLFEHQAVVLPVLVDAAEPDGRPSWIAALPGAHRVPPFSTVGTSGELLLDLLFQPRSLLRALAVDRDRQRRLIELGTLIDGELQQRLALSANRRRLQGEGLMGGDAVANQRQGFERCRDRLQDDLAALRRDREQHLKGIQRVGGEVDRFIKQEVAALDFDDLRQDVAGPNLQLSLDAETHQRLQQAVERAARRHTVEGLRVLDEGLRATIAEIERRLAEIGGHRQHLDLTPLDPNTLWDKVVSAARPEIRYRGEMQRTTFFSRLSAARRSIMGVMMLGMILGGVGTLLGSGSSLRTWLYAAMLPLFLIGFLWTYVSGGRQEALRLTKELERLRDGVGQELKRVMAEVLREVQTGYADWLQDTGKQLAKQLEQRMRAFEEEQRSGQERQRQQQQERNRNLDQLDRGLQRHQQELVRVGKELQEADRILRDWSRELVGGLTARQHELDSTGDSPTAS